MTVLLMYIGTWFLFQLTFLDLHKPDPPVQARAHERSLDTWVRYLTSLELVRLHGRQESQTALLQAQLEACEHILYLL